MDNSIPALTYKYLVLEVKKDNNTSLISAFELKNSTAFNLEDKKGIKEINKKIKESIKELYTNNFINKIPDFWRRAKISKAFKKINKYDVICFVNDNEITAFHPECKLLNFLLGFSINYNCLDLLIQSIEIIGKELIDYPIRNVSKDTIAYLKSTKPEGMRFLWSNGWMVSFRIKKKGNFKDSAG